jgi:CheY-like chemotaxis protein
MKKILIVDDQACLRRLLSVTLRNDYEIIEASDGVEALAMVRAHMPDAVLLDIMMPGELDGLQVLQAIRVDPIHKKTLVAMVTARGQVVDREKGKELQANAYFVKPFRPLEMVQWLRERLT